MTECLVLQGSSADRSQWREPTRTPDGLCSLYEAALCLFEEVKYKYTYIHVNWLYEQERAMSFGTRSPNKKLLSQCVVLCYCK